jgi:hypothetical protein
MNPSPCVLVADLAYLFLLFREKREEDGGIEPGSVGQVGHLTKVRR